MRARPWFQYHLSTAIVLMFVAGGLMWANVRESKLLAYFLDSEFEWDRSRSDYAQIEYLVGFHGWPSFCAESVYFDRRGEIFVENVLNLPCLALNTLTALAILAAAAVACEWRIIIRRKKLDGPRAPKYVEDAQHGETRP